MDYEYLLNEQAYLAAMLDDTDSPEELELMLIQLDKLEFQINEIQGTTNNE